MVTLYINDKPVKFSIKDKMITMKNYVKHKLENRKHSDKNNSTEKERIKRFDSAKEAIEQEAINEIEMLHPLILKYKAIKHTTKKIDFDYMFGKHIMDYLDEVIPNIEEQLDFIDMLSEKVDEKLG